MRSFALGFALGAALGAGGAWLVVLAAFAEPVTRVEWRSAGRG